MSLHVHHECSRCGKPMGNAAEVALQHDLEEEREQGKQSKALSAPSPAEMDALAAKIYKAEDEPHEETPAIPRLCEECFVSYQQFVVDRLAGVPY